MEFSGVKLQMNLTKYYVYSKFQNIPIISFFTIVTCETYTTNFYVSLKKVKFLVYYFFCVNDKSVFNTKIFT